MGAKANDHTSPERQANAPDWTWIGELDHGNLLSRRGKI
jgi:hypothetical protein